jgi:hypothetical protein
MKLEFPPGGSVWLLDPRTGRPTTTEDLQLVAADMV